jgi:hypothetical protein
VVEQPVEKGRLVHNVCHCLPASSARTERWQPCLQVVGRLESHHRPAQQVVNLSLCDRVATPTRGGSRCVSTHPVPATIPCGTGSVSRRDGGRTSFCIDCRSYSRRAKPRRVARFAGPRAFAHILGRNAAATRSSPLPDERPKKAWGKAGRACAGAGSRRLPGRVGTT